MFIIITATTFNGLENLYFDVAIFGFGRGNSSCGSGGADSFIFPNFDGGSCGLDIIQGHRNGKRDGLSSLLAHPLFLQFD